MVGEFIAHDSMFAVLKLESRGYVTDLDRLAPAPGPKSAFGAKRTWTGRQNRMDQSKMK